MIYVILHLNQLLVSFDFLTNFVQYTIIIIIMLTVSDEHKQNTTNVLGITVGLGAVTSCSIVLLADSCAYPILCSVYIAMSMHSYL